jgi:hypothetical protein
VGCGDVVDSRLGQEAVVLLKDRVARQANFQVSWQRVDFYGWCRRCGLLSKDAKDAKDVKDVRDGTGSPASSQPLSQPA